MEVQKVGEREGIGGPYSAGSVRPGPDEATEAWRESEREGEMINTLIPFLFFVYSLVNT